MKKIFRAVLCAALCAVMLLGLCGCGGETYYKVIDTYSQDGSYAIAFRKDDKLCELVTAALKELVANGTMKTTSYVWFGDNLVGMRGDEGAMDELWDEVGDRTLTVGVDITNMPMSYESADGYSGFDVDLANYICGYLGYSLVIYPINPEDVRVELASGNIDMAMGVPVTDESDELSYSPTYLTSSYVLVARVRGNVNSRSALRGKTLGVAVTDIDILQEDPKFVEKLGGIIYQTNTDGLFQALLNGEVDGILVSSVVAAYYMK